MIETVQLTVQAGAFRLKDVSFRIPTGSYCVLMGKTGSGKTTLLEAVCGLKRVVTGEIRLFGESVAHLKAAERGIGFVPQDGALFATMSVRDHLEFAMRIRHWPRRKVADRVDELASLLDVDDLLARKPLGLSGGESQRVALGRALSFQPRVLCLDEPLSALDDDTRLEMIELLKRVQKEAGVTALHVTHNRLEAERLADERLQIVDGKVIELRREAAQGNGKG